MTVYDDATLGAYVDGELDGAAREALERAVATDPDLARRVETHRRLRRALGATFDATLTEPVPERLLRVARGSNEDTVVPMRAPTRTGAAGWRAPHWWAMAASLVVGVLLGRQVLVPTERETLVAAGPDGAVATGVLATALSHQLVADRDRVVQIGLSFRATTGQYCRTFEVRGRDAAQAGLACREPDAWRVEVLETVDPGAATPEGLRQASSSGLPESVRRAVESSISGDVLDAAAEAAARESGWR